MSPREVVAVAGLALIAAAIAVARPAPVLVGPHPAVPPLEVDLECGDCFTAQTHGLQIVHGPIPDDGEARPLVAVHRSSADASAWVPVTLPDGRVGVWAAREVRQEAGTVVLDPAGPWLRTGTSTSAIWSAQGEIDGRPLRIEAEATVRIRSWKALEEGLEVWHGWLWLGEAGAESDGRAPSASE